MNGTHLDARPADLAAEWHERAAALDDPRRWPEAATELVGNLGFLLVEADAAAGPGGHLVIALRDRPTFAHFDPESIAYYAPVPDGATLSGVDRRTLERSGAQGSRTVLWGHVHVLDRLPVDNRFLTFGGELRTLAVDASLTIVDLRSPAPIVRWGGHSQGSDTLAGAIGAFFGRLIVPVDFVPGAAAQIDTVAPEILYRAFLADASRRRARAVLGGGDQSELDVWLRHAWTRARADVDACAAAEALLTEIAL